ncbi:MAG: FlgD immunoglobulin-like domain containing protein [Candidatus Zixiibacteriota bacterium]
MLGKNLCGLGDINGDGFDDVAFSSYQPLGTYVYFGGNQADTAPAYFLRGVGNMAAGVDMTGDGIPDIAIQSPEDRVLLYRGLGDSIESVPSDSIQPPIAYRYGYSVRTGLVSNDAVGDLVLIDYLYPGGGRAYYYENPFTADKEPDWSFTNQNLSHVLGNVDFIDFDGDGFQDIVLSRLADLDSVSAVYVFKGPSFSGVPDMVIGAPVELDTLGYPDGRSSFARRALNIGDFNGDGWEDLAVLYKATSVLYYGGPTYDTVFDLVSEVPSWAFSSAGDVNGDGWNDFLCGFTRTWFGALDLFLGGVRADSVSDYTVYESDFAPYPDHSIGAVGKVVASAGDFNNDGYDDLLVANENNECCDWEFGSVYVLAGGPQIVVPVIEQEPLALPAKFVLRQNYPNPFNLATTIRFTVPIRLHVSVHIYNSLGEEVATLLDRTIQAGDHTVTWNGRDAKGKEVSSGIYVCVLSDGMKTYSIKMLLLK